MIIDPVLPVWALIIMVGTASSLMTYLEIQRKLKYKTWRLISIAVISIAIVIILVRPKYRVTESAKLLLLTQNYERKAVDSLLNISSYTLRHYGSAAPYKGSTSIRDLDLLNNFGNIKAVVGNGLPTDLLDKLQHSESQFVFAEPKAISGITDFSISKCEADRVCQISGEIRTRSACTLYVASASVNEDSVKILKAGIHKFALNIRPKLAGTFMYEFRIQYDDETTNEPLPLKVTEGKKLKVLFLQQYPSFEQNSLKNYLENQEHHLAVRYQVSKNVYRSEFINYPKVNLNRVTSELLDDFDLLISDSPTLLSLTKGEQSSIISSVKNGLGILNTEPLLQRKDDSFFPFEVSKVSKDTVHISTRNNEKTILPTSAIRVVSSSTVTPTQRDDAGIISGYTTMGLGKIGFQLIRQTFPTMLSGDSITYANLWTSLLEQIAKAEVPPTRLSIVTPFPWYEHHPVDIIITSALDSVPQVSSDGVPLPVIEDAIVDNVWYTRTWAGKPGWHRIETRHDTLDYWVAPSGNWKTLSLANQVRANQLQSNNNAQTESNTTVWKEIPSLIPYVMILFAAGFLWLAPKL